MTLSSTTHLDLDYDYDYDYDYDNDYDNDNDLNDDKRLWTMTMTDYKNKGIIL